MSYFRIEVVDIPTRENLVAEVFYKNEQWIEISQEKDELLIRFYSPEDRNFWEFNYNEAMEAIERAKTKLMMVG